MYETKEEYERFMQIMLKQQEKVKRSKAAAKALLKRSGLWDLIIPKDAVEKNNKKSKKKEKKPAKKKSKKAAAR